MVRLQHPILVLVSIILAILLFSFYDDIIATIVRNNVSDIESIQQYETITWEITPNEDTYTTFLNSLRNHLSSGVTVCGKPVTPKLPTKKYILVELKPNPDHIMTIVIRKSDCYFLGYQDKVNNVYRANFVKDEFKELDKSDLFKGVKTRLELPYKSGYTSLERTAGIGRKDLAIGINDLKAFYEIVYGVDYKSKTKPKDIGRNLAKFALIAIQMISEPARFIYIKNQVISHGIYGIYKPDADSILLANKWAKISEAIHGSAPACKPVKVDELPFDDIKTQVSLLKFKGDK